MSKRAVDIEALMRPGGMVPVNVETTAGLVREVLRLREALEAILLLNGTNDLPDAWRIAEAALFPNQQATNDGS